jgi:hypothetical protein
VAAGTYAFYFTGVQSSFGNGASYAFVAAGELQIDASGNITGGDEDYNNGNLLNATGTVVNGTLTANSTGQGSLTFTTTPTGANAIPLEDASGFSQTYAITVVNQKHILLTASITGTAVTASGTLDYQTPGTGLSQLAGNWSFAVKGQKNGATYSQGGVFTLGSSSQTAACPTTTNPCSPVTNMVTDYNEGSGQSRTIVLGDGSETGGYFSAPDQFGRGQAFFSGIYWDYYVIGPKAIRLLGYNPQVGTYNQVYFGSAYGQGTTASFEGPFVFSDAGTALTPSYGAAGLITFNGTGNITGYADVSETPGTVTSAAFGATYQTNIPVSVSGQAAAPVNGYGRITIAPGSTEDISVLGVYAVDPTLNILDPNDTTAAGQGALIADLDQRVAGDGVLMAQNATSVSQDNYVIATQTFGANSFYKTSNGGLDLVGQVNANTSGAIIGTVSVSNQINNTNLSTNVVFSTTLAADGSHLGRFTAPLSLTLGSGTAYSFNLVFYQANALQFIEFSSGPSGASGTGTLQLQPQP